jgi:cysteine sulfinate desulfinase/cysteine desulfurase-like protein
MNQDFSSPISLPVYSDPFATTAVDPRVLGAILPYFREHYGNPLNRGHALGARAAAAVDEARAAVAALVGATANAIVFTSGATESIHLALQGVVEAADGSRKRVVTVAGEHKATWDTLAALERRGVDVVTVPVDGEGRVEPEAVARALETPTVLLTCLHGNNEVGTLPPVSALGRIARERGVLFHVDAAPTAGKVPLDVEAMHVDLLSLSAHKFYGPKGVGALFVRRSRPRARVAPQLQGGGQERGLRSGTLNVPGIVGLGAAASLAWSLMADESPRPPRSAIAWRAVSRRMFPICTGTVTAASAFPATGTSAFPAWKGGRCGKACAKWRCRPAPRAPATRRRTCSGRWASTNRLPARRFDLVWGASRRKRKSTSPPKRWSVTGNG